MWARVLMSTYADHALCRDGNATLFLPEFTNWRYYT